MKEPSVGHHNKTSKIIIHRQICLSVDSEISNSDLKVEYDF